jgi:peptidoglycan/LPS O-acetylase OafA/YrhL
MTVPQMSEVRALDHATVPTARPHLPQLDALRGAAAAMVLLFHIYGDVYRSQLAAPRPPWSGFFADGLSLTRLVALPCALGYAGVPLFFVLSGFCIHYAQLRSPAPFSYGRFMWRRAWRIYPAYLAAIAVALLLLPGPLQSVHHLRKTLLLHLAMLHNFFDHDIFELNPSFWTLPIEFQFYAGYPLLLWMRRKIGMTWATGVAVAVSLVLVGWLCLRGGSAKIEANPLVFWGQWCIGALIAERFIQGRPILLKPARVLPICLPLVLLATPSRYWTWAAPLWALVFAALIDAWVRRDARWLPRWTLWLGTISYSLYLLHQSLISLILSHLPATSDARFATMLLVAPAPIVVVAATSYYLFERPGMWIGHRVGPGRRAGQT